jgi:hypothetical protein
MFLVLAWCIFQRKVQNEGNMPNKRIFVSEKLGCNGTNADLHMEEGTTRFNLCYNRPYVHIIFFFLQICIKCIFGNNYSTLALFAVSICITNAQKRKFALEEN